MCPDNHATSQRHRGCWACPGCFVLPACPDGVPHGLLGMARLGYLLYCVVLLDLLYCVPHVRRLVGAVLASKVTR